MRIVLAFLFLAACKREEIEVYEVDREKTETAVSAGSAAAPARPASGAAAGELAWTLPAGWRQAPGEGMRRATILIPSADGPVELSVVVLPGPAGGELANVNRWRGQLGLGPAAQAGERRVAGAAGSALLVEFTGAAGKGLLGAILTFGDSTWFFKAVAPPAVLSNVKPDFVKFVASLRPA